MVPPCDDIPDFELIRRMADQKADFAGAKGAWGRLYVRHHRFLLRVCTSDHGYLLGLEGVNDLVQDAFLKAFDGATTFDHAEPCGVAVQQRKCRGWLVRIAENLVRDRYRGQPDVHTVDDDEIARLAGTDRDSDEIQLPENERLKLLKSGFALLSDTEQTVLRATMFWWQADQQYQRMPQAAAHCKASRWINGGEFCSRALQAWAMANNIGRVLSGLGGQWKNGLNREFQRAASVTSIERGVVFVAGRRPTEPGEIPRALQLAASG